MQSAGHTSNTFIFCSGYNIYRVYTAFSKKASEF